MAPCSFSRISARALRVVIGERVTVSVRVIRDTKLRHGLLVVISKAVAAHRLRGANGAGKFIHCLREIALLAGVRSINSLLQEEN